MTTTVRCVDPLTMGDQLKRLFTENDRPEYPGWFDRAYPIAVRDGARSWVSLNADERVIAHVAGFTATVSVHGRDVRGALLCNLMADKGHRTFFPVVAAVKRAVGDLRSMGAEFIYTNPINPGSVAVMRAAGLRRIGAQNRFLLPLGGVDGPISLLLLARTWLGNRPERRVVAEEVEVSLAVDWTVRERCSVSPVTTRRSPEVYFMRWEGFDTGADRGFIVRDASGRDTAAAIVRVEGDEGTLITLRCRSLDRVEESVAALARTLRELGLRRVNAYTLEGTPFAAALVRGGFIQRNEPWTIVAAGFTDAGRQVAAGLAYSDLEKIDVD
jgi:hypothetical protein